MDPLYLESYRTGRLQESIRRAARWMSRCTMCPRLCGVDRMGGETGYCRTGCRAVVSSYGAHFGEERPLVGGRGSGTIFFANCNLSCIFCQNYEISHGGEGVAVSSEQFAAIMVELQQQGAHNINFVTPSHVIHPILEALPAAIEGGLRVPLVYNCGGYDRVSALKLLEGIVDIYMPDFKFWDSAVAGELCDAGDYPERARAALREMHRQVGDLDLDPRGVATKGLLVRHLVMPNNRSGTEGVLHFIATEISRNTYVNVMSQYHPCGEAPGRADIGRALSPAEFQAALEVAKREGLSRLDERCRHWITLDFRD